MCQFITVLQNSDIILLNTATKKKNKFTHQIFTKETYLTCAFILPIMGVIVLKVLLSIKKHTTL